MKQRQTKEDYLKTIYLLSKTQEVHGVTIAQSLEVTRSTVSILLKALAADGYLYKDARHVVHLTAKGEQMAIETYERHQTLKKALIAIGVDEQTASGDACKMEHAVSPRTVAALKAFVTHSAVPDAAQPAV